VQDLALDHVEPDDIKTLTRCETKLLTSPKISHAAAIQKVLRTHLPFLQFLFLFGNFSLPVVLYDI